MRNNNILSIKRHLPEVVAIAIGGLLMASCGEDDPQPIDGKIKTYERSEAKGYVVDKITDGGVICYVAYHAKEETRMDPIGLSIDCLEEKK